MYIRSVKILAFILSIYILALNFTPCGDSKSLDSLDNTELSQTFDVDHDHNALDSCSPFCICQCCQINIDIVDFYSYTLISEDNFKGNPSYKNSVTQEVSHSLYQPPQV